MSGGLNIAWGLAAATLLAAVPAAGAGCPPPDDRASLEAKVASAEQLAIERDGASDIAGAIGAYQAALDAQRGIDCGAGLGTARLLAQLGWLEYRAGRHADAETHLRTAIDSDRAQSAPPVRLADALNKLGAVERDNGRYEAAERTFREALAVMGPSDEEGIRGAIYNNLGGLCLYRSDYRGAMEAYRTALALFDARGANAGDIAKVLNNLGIVQHELGDERGARDAYLRALQLKESAFGQDHPSTASTVSNLAVVTDLLGDHTAAEALFSRAAASYRKAFGSAHPKLGEVLESWGESRQRAGDPTGAAPLLDQALAIYERSYGPESQWVGESLLARVLVDIDRGDLVLARPRAARAVAIAIASGEKELLWTSWAEEAQLLARSGDLPAAVFFGKQAVNQVQQMRAEVAGLERPLQQSFLARREKAYRDLLAWLITLGRLSEAEEVMTMLKEEEYFDFVRPALRGSDAGNARASDATSEVLARRNYDRATIRLAEAGRRVREAPPSQAEQLRTTLREDLANHQIALRAVVTTLARAEAATQRVRAKEPDAGRRIPEGAAVVSYLVTPHYLRILLASGLGRRAFEIPIEAAELNQRVFALRQAVQDPRSDPRPPAQALHAVLIRPLEEELEREKVQNLWLVLDGTLRLVPFAALHDGRSYLVEQRALTVVTLASRDAAAAATGVDRLAAFGATRSLDGLPALPRVASELRRIVKRDPGDSEGLLPGVVVLDADFTAERLSRTLAEGYPLVHVASHFVFRPGPLDQSFLVLGDGGKLTLEQMKRGELSLRSVRLLALSACSTAVGEGGEGRELESFGTLAHRLGAAAVLASLWQVADLSTATLMTRFYAQRETAGQDEALALATAQRSFLGPSAPASWGHPFYWAPFLVLASR